MPPSFLGRSASLLMLSVCWPLPVPSMRRVTEGGLAFTSARALAMLGPITLDTVPTLRITIDPLPERPSLAVVTADHQIIAIASNGRVLIGYDAEGKESWRKSISSNESGGFRFFFSVLHGPRGRIDVWDHLQNRLTSMNATGHVRGQRRIKALPMVTIGGGGRSPQYLVMLGALANGDIIARTSFDPGASAVSGVHEDSTEIVRVDAEGTPHVLRETLMAAQFRRSAPYLIQGIVPFGRVGSVGVGDAGWYFTDGTAFTIERRAPDGALLDTFGTPRSRRLVTGADIRTSRLRALADADSTLKPSMVSTLAWMPYPDSMPAYAGLHVDAHGWLWAEVFTPPWEAGHWELFDQAGTPLGTVALPPGLRILDIGEDVLLAYHAEPGGDAELRTYRLMRPRP